MKGNLPSKRTKEQTMPFQQQQTTLKEASLRSQYVIVVLLDIKGAFDNITTDAINKSMIDSQIPDTIRKWYYR